MVLSFFPEHVKAQSCGDAYYQARDYYYKGKFDVIPSLLGYCVRDFNQNYRNYYQRENPEMVFRVYKLITASYYQMDLDYEAEEKENELISFFYGIYDADMVLDRLSYTEL